MRETLPYDVIIIGAGAAGLMCAITAGKRGRRVLVLQHTDRIAGKIRVAGGGKCNFTNCHVSPEHFISANPQFVHSALARFTPDEICAFLKKHRVAYHEKKDGQLFCVHSALDVVHALKEECASTGVVIQTGIHVADVHQKTGGDGFIARGREGSWECRSLVVASGGLSFPVLGATDYGYRLAARFGLKVTPRRPGLVPLVFQPLEREIFGGLSGVSFAGEVRCGEVSFKESILFTHKGLSGPAILQISSCWQEGLAVGIDFLPGVDLKEMMRKNSSRRLEMKTFLGRFLPGRLAQVLSSHGFANKPLCQYSEKEINTIARTLKAFTFVPAGTEGYRKAEVTLGGVDTAELSSRTMESVKVPGLYFIGEVVDVTGHLGGFNLHWAWASGHAAGLAI